VLVAIVCINIKEMIVIIYQHHLFLLMNALIEIIVCEVTVTDMSLINKRIIIP
jgi:hypothetical protein